MIGAHGLDAGCLGELETQDLVWGTKPQPGNRRYVVWCRERWAKAVPLFGMHNGEFRGVWYTILGDNPSSNKIQCFPDLMWQWRKNDEKSEVEIERIMSQVNRVFASLSEGHSVHSTVLRDQMNSVTDGDPIETLGLLSELELIERKHDNYHSLIPVFMINDLAFKPVVDKVVSTVVGIIKRHYTSFENSYKKTLPYSNDVPIQETLNQVYHQVYSKAIQHLMKNRVLHETPIRPDGYRYLPYVTIL